MHPLCMCAVSQVCSKETTFTADIAKFAVRMCSRSDSADTCAQGLHGTGRVWGLCWQMGPSEEAKTLRWHCCRSLPVKVQ